MNDDLNLDRLLQKAYPPISAVTSDLWPSMEARLAHPARRVHWFEWALVCAVLALMVAAPSVVPMLLSWW